MSSINSIAPLIVPSALPSAQAGLATADQALAQAAQQIANPNGGDLVASLIDANQSLILAKAAAGVIKTVDQSIGSLLNTYA